MPSNFNYENFQQVANGFFQAEGAVGACRIRNLKFIPVFVLTQNYSIESLNFFFNFVFRFSYFDEITCDIHQAMETSN